MTTFARPGTRRPSAEQSSGRGTRIFRALFPWLVLIGQATCSVLVGYLLLVGFLLGGTNG